MDYTNEQVQQILSRHGYTEFDQARILLQIEHNIIKAASQSWILRVTQNGQERGLTLNEMIDAKEKNADELSKKLPPQLKYGIAYDALKRINDFCGNYGAYGNYFESIDRSIPLLFAIGGAAGAIGLVKAMGINFPPINEKEFLAAFAFGGFGCLFGGVLSIATAMGIVEGAYRASELLLGYKEKKSAEAEQRKEQTLSAQIKEQYTQQQKLQLNSMQTGEIYLGKDSNQANFIVIGAKNGETPREYIWKLKPTKWNLNFNHLNLLPERTLIAIEKDGEKEKVNGFYMGIMGGAIYFSRQINENPYAKDKRHGNLDGLRLDYLEEKGYNIRLLSLV